MWQERAPEFVSRIVSLPPPTCARLARSGRRRSKQAPGIVVVVVCPCPSQLGRVTRQLPTPTSTSPLASLVIGPSTNAILFFPSRNSNAATPNPPLRGHLPSQSLYCSEGCKLHDTGDLSASASNSSYFPSSLSTSSSPSPLFGPTKASRQVRHPAWTYRSSRGSSPTSSPSPANSDIPDLSDEDAGLCDPSALDSTFRAPRVRGSKQSVLDNSMWKGKPGVPQAIPAVQPSRHRQGSMSMPGLHYVRKPGPINSLGMLAGPSSSSDKLQQSHRRFGSDAQMQYVLPRNASSGYTDLAYLNSQDRDSSNGGLSSTPKSKNAFHVSPSSKCGINGHPSDAIPGSGHSTRRVPPFAFEPRDVSDSQVQTRRQLSQNQPFRGLASSSAAAATTHLSISHLRDVPSITPRGTAVSKKQSASALSALRGVAKVHGVSRSGRQQSQTTILEFNQSDTNSESDHPPATATATVHLSNLWPKLNTASTTGPRRDIARPSYVIDGKVSPMTSRRKNDHVRTRESHTRMQRSISPTGDEYSGDDRAQYRPAARFYESPDEVDPSGQQEARRGRSRQR